MNKVAIVILNWNGLDMLSKFLPSVLKNSRHEATIYVADNASEDASIDLLIREFPDVRLILLDKNYGFAGGYNKALKEVEAEYYMILNSDVETPCGWLTPLIEFMDSHVEVAACQPKILSQVDNESFEYAGASGGFIDKYGYPFCRGRIFSSIEKDLNQYDEEIKIHWATGAAMLIRAQDFWHVGGFDEGFFAHEEEIDLCWRLRSTGRKIYCVPKSKVYHVGGGTLPKDNPMKTFLNFRNNLIMLYKNLPQESLKPIMRVRGFLDYLAAVQFLLKGKWADFKAVLRARHAYRELLPMYVQVRKEVQKACKNSGPAKNCNFSILWQYHALRRHSFSKIIDKEGIE